MINVKEVPTNPKSPAKYGINCWYVGGGISCGIGLVFLIAGAVMISNYVNFDIYDYYASWNDYFEMYQYETIGAVLLTVSCILFITGGICFFCGCCASCCYAASGQGTQNNIPVVIQYNTQPGTIGNSVKQPLPAQMAPAYYQQGQMPSIPQGVQYNTQPGTIGNGAQQPFPTQMDPVYYPQSQMLGISQVPNNESLPTYKS